MLIQTGQWYWRDGEVSYASFQKMNKEEKQKHLQFLQGLKLNNLSSNDKLILTQYKIRTEEITEQFLKL